MATQEVGVSLLFFAKSRELVGKKEDEICLPCRITPGDLLQTILTKYPSLKPLEENITVALNQNYLSREDSKPLSIKAGDEIAIIPPLSGGNNTCNMPGDDFVHITADKLSAEGLTQRVSTPTAGAVSVFIGITRDHFDDKKVVRLEYECYSQMAEKEMKKICLQVREKWAVENIAMIHRTGVVPVMEASVIIAISSVHRREAIEAVQFAIDTLKSTVPIWKKEIYADGTDNWKQNKECDWSAVDKSAPNQSA